MPVCLCPSVCVCVCVCGRSKLEGAVGEALRVLRSPDLLDEDCDRLWEHKLQLDAAVEKLRSGEWGGRGESAVCVCLHIYIYICVCVYVSIFHTSTHTHCLVHHGSPSSALMCGFSRLAGKGICKQWQSHADSS